MLGRLRNTGFLVLALAGLVGLSACTTPPGGGGNNKAPVAVASGNPGSSAMEIAFSSGGSYDPDGTIVGYLWDFGDGSATSGAENPSHTYVSVGTFVATLTVTDALGSNATAQVSVTVPVVPNQPPVAVATATPNDGAAPLAVAFSSAGSNDPDGGVITSYLWDFGDGITSTAANPAHTYAALGTFTATLTVTDSSGATGSTTVSVTTWESEIRNPAQGRCADVDRSNTSNGVWVLSYPCTGNDNQRWVLGANGRISSALNANKCLDALGSGELGTNVGIWDCNGGLNQRWIRSGSTLVNDANDLCLATYEGSVVPSKPLVVTTCNPADPAQQWVVAEWQERPNQRVRNTAFDLCVTVANNGLSNGRAVKDWACDDHATSAWYLDPNGYMINRAGATWCMDGSGGTLGSAVVIWPCGADKSWQLWHVSGSQLVNDTNNLCLARASSTSDPGSTMVLADCDANDDAQKFAFEATQ